MTAELPMIIHITGMLRGSHKNPQQSAKNLPKDLQEPCNKLEGVLHKHCICLGALAELVRRPLWGHQACGMAFNLIFFSCCPPQRIDKPACLRWPPSKR